MIGIKNNNKKGINPFISGAVGAVAGAAAVAGAVALANKDNRKKVMKFAQNLKDKGKNLQKKIKEVSI